MDEWGLEALELKAWMVILGTEIGENSDTHKLIGELGGLYICLYMLYITCYKILLLNHIKCYKIHLDFNFEPSILLS